MDNKNSNLNTVLLVVLVVLVGGLLFMMWNKDDKNEMIDDQSQNQIEQIPNSQNEVQDNQESVNNIDKKNIYNSNYISFSYNGIAKELKNDSIGIVNIGTNSDDPYMETVAYFSDTDQVDPSENLIFQKNLIIDDDKFELYASDESGSSIYVLRKNNTAISLYIPYRFGTNYNPLYVDLKSLKIK